MTYLGVIGEKGAGEMLLCQCQTWASKHLDKLPLRWLEYCSVYTRIHTYTHTHARKRTHTNTNTQQLCLFSCHSCADQLALQSCIWILLYFCVHLIFLLSHALSLSLSLPFFDMVPDTFTPTHILSLRLLISPAAFPQCAVILPPPLSQRHCWHSDL